MAMRGHNLILNPKPYTNPCRQMQVGGPRYEMTGFHAKRSEFEHEYDNDAELLISELEFRPTDTVVSVCKTQNLKP